MCHWKCVLNRCGAMCGASRIPPSSSFRLGLNAAALSFSRFSARCDLPLLMRAKAVRRCIFVLLDLFERLQSSFTVPPLCNGCNNAPQRHIQVTQSWFLSPLPLSRLPPWAVCCYALAVFAFLKKKIFFRCRINARMQQQQTLSSALSLS